MQCASKYKGVRCFRHNGHLGLHEAEFPRFHCHVDREGKITPNKEQPVRWETLNGRNSQVPRKTANCYIRL